MSPSLKREGDLIRIPANPRNRTVGRILLIVGAAGLFVGLIPLILGEGLFDEDYIMVTMVGMFGVMGLGWGLGLLLFSGRTLLVDRKAKTLTVGGEVYTRDQITVIRVHSWEEELGDSTRTLHYIVAGIGGPSPTPGVIPPEEDYDEELRLVRLSMFHAEWGVLTAARLAITMDALFFHESEQLDPRAYLQEHRGAEG